MGFWQIPVSIFDVTVFQVPSSFSAGARRLALAIITAEVHHLFDGFEEIDDALPNQLKLFHIILYLYYTPYLLFCQVYFMIVFPNTKIPLNRAAFLICV